MINVKCTELYKYIQYASFSLISQYFSCRPCYTVLRFHLEKRMAKNACLTTSRFSIVAGTSHESLHLLLYWKSFDFLQLINPIKAKEKLVEQLQTQIVDLERFVSFLQTENGERPPNSIASIPVIPVKRNSFLNIVGCNRKFERNILKNTLQGNHYGFVQWPFTFL